MKLYDIDDKYISIGEAVEEEHFNLILNEVGSCAAWLYYDRLPSTRLKVDDAFLQKEIREAEAKDVALLDLIAKHNSRI